MYHMALPPFFFLIENMLYFMVQFKIHLYFKNEFYIYINIVTLSF